MIEFEKKKSAHKTSNVLVEKYRPQKVKQVLLPKRFKNLFNSFIEEQEIQNMVIHSKSPGSGKTTIAKALANDCGYVSLYINASMHSGIATLRDEIAEFASVSLIGSGEGKAKKVVILDEFDFATQTLQAGLRGAIEEFYDKCRFIMTANNLGRIIEPLKSRCIVMNFDFTEQDKNDLSTMIETRLCGIADKEEIEYEEGVMGKIVNAFYPDIRKMINTVSEYSRLYGRIDDDIFTFTQIDEELKELIFDLDFKKARKYILDKNYKHEDLYRYVFDEIIPAADDSLKGELYKLTSDYIDMATRSWDQEITFTGFLVSLMEILGEA